MCIQCLREHLLIEFQAIVPDSIPNNYGSPFRYVFGSEVQITSKLVSRTLSPSFNWQYSPIIWPFNRSTSIYKKILKGRKYIFQAWHLTLAVFIKNHSTISRSSNSISSSGYSSCVNHCRYTIKIPKYDWTKIWRSLTIYISDNKCY